MTHVDNNDKSSATFTWVPPSSVGTGTVTVQATIVFVETTYYQISQSLPEVVATTTAAPTTTTLPPLNTPPYPPTNLASNYLTNSSVTLTWYAIYFYHFLKSGLPQ